MMRIEKFMKNDLKGLSLVELGELIQKCGLEITESDRRISPLCYTFWIDGLVSEKSAKYDECEEVYLSIFFKDGVVEDDELCEEIYYKILDNKLAEVEEFVSGFFMHHNLFYDSDNILSHKDFGVDREVLILYDFERVNEKRWFNPKTTMVHEILNDIVYDIKEYYRFLKLMNILTDNNVDIRFIEKNDSFFGERLLFEVSDFINACNIKLKLKLDCDITDEHIALAKKLDWNALDKNVESFDVSGDRLESLLQMVLPLGIACTNHVKRAI